LTARALLSGALGELGCEGLRYSEWWDGGDRACGWRDSFCNGGAAVGLRGNRNSKRPHDGLIA